MNKRYAIVRVDDKCPLYLREFTDQEAQTMFCCSGKYMCKKCRYGDTKEQLIRKVATGIEIAINEYEKGNIPKGKENRRCAEIIVEFLGVEE